MKKNYFLLTFMVLVYLNAFAQKPNNMASGFLEHSAASNNLTALDVQDKVVTHQHTSNTSGVHHFYYAQRYQGVQVNDATASVHVLPNGQLLTLHNHFISDLQSKIVGAAEPALTGSQAIMFAAQHLGYSVTEPLELLEDLGGVEQNMTFSKSNISKNDIPVRLMYQPMDDGSIKLAWDLSINATAETNWWSLRVDAATGVVLHKNSWTVKCNLEGHSHAHDETCATINDEELIDEVTNSFSPATAMVGSYTVYAMPVESPNFGVRTTVVNPDNGTASPFGWHDTNGSTGNEYTVTRGNNVHAYEDGDNPDFNPDGGGSLIFDFPINTTYSNNNQSESAAITNLFYWGNITHDLWYLYGFDEASGNFQENNYGNGGLGSDYVRCEAQDGGGTCNANMGTPPDGGNPTMQMYVCGTRDGDLDNGVIVHEYGHGISIRLTGGAGTSNCLNNTEQMGEGWSDYFGMVMSIEAGDAGTDSRGMGTWLFGQGPNGNGIRPHPYSTDMNINPHTYDDIQGVSVPHGVGSVWCAMLWEMTWDLIGVYGFDPDFYNGTGGNNIAMALVIEGLKLQPCSPGFVDGRDAILAADLALNGGANECLIWAAFAKRGLGVDADQGSTGSRSDGTENFDLPAACLGPAISFNIANINTIEGASPENPSPSGDCRPYTEYDIDVTLSQDALLAAPEITISEVSGMSTVNSDDYELFGDYMIFLTAGTQTATLRVYNDAIIEVSETLVLEITIDNAGSTDAFLGSIPEMNIQVDNDDYAPENQVTITNIADLGYESNMEGYTTTNAASGQGASSLYAQGTAADASSSFWTVPSPLDGSSGLIYANDDDCDCTMADVKFISPVYDFSANTAITLKYDIFFEGNTYQGNQETADLMVSISGGAFTVVQSISGVNGNWREESVDLSAYAGEGNVRIAFRYNDGGGWLYGIALDHIRIDGAELDPPLIATTLNFIDEQDVPANADVYFYHSDGSLLARLENGSNDLGCVTVSIDRAGEGATEFWDNDAEHYLADKTYLFTPEFNGTNYDYDVTLYYTRTEVNAWENITGNIWAQAFVVKHVTAIEDVTPSNPGGNGLIDQAVDGVGVLPWSSNNYFITAHFTTGFSGMGVGNPGTEPLPVELIGFEGEHIKGESNYLTWRTASEMNNDYFDLERSFDGRDFESITQIQGAGTTDEINVYEYHDRAYKTGEHYYRLKQVDTDGHFEYSEVVVLSVNASDLEIAAFPNPAKNDLTVTFATDINSTLNLSVFSVNGKNVKTQTIKLNGENSFNLSIEELPKGVYYAEMIDTNSGFAYQFRFVKE